MEEKIIMPGLELCEERCYSEVVDELDLERFREENYKIFQGEKMRDGVCVCVCVCVHASAHGDQKRVLGSLNTST